jgi:ribonuclease D
MKAHPGLLSTAAQIKQLAETLRNHDVIAFDTEFIRETTFFPVVEILQIATDQESWLVDAKAFQKGGQPREALAPLLEILEDKKILKVAHAIQGDQECLYTTFGVVATPTLDTAVAASLCGYGDGIGLSNLLKAVMGVVLKKGHARTDWSVRPLPQQLEVYAHADVEFLVELSNKLLSELDERDRRQWAMELSSKWEDKSLYEPNAEEIALKIARGGRLDRRGYAALVELVKWREERVRQLNLPRRWIADDNLLSDLAQVRPKDMTHLGAFRGLNRGELKNSGEAILAALKRASEVQETTLPKIPKPDLPSTSESQVLDLLKTYLGILADEHRIASRHLIGTAQLLSLLRVRADSPADWVKQGILTEGAAHLIGAELIALLKGKRALAVEGSRIRIVELK